MHADNQTSRLGVVPNSTPILTPTPSAIYPFCDKIQFWVHEPIDNDTLAQLRAQCGGGNLFSRRGPARFNGHRRQRVELKQPTKEALQWLAGRDDAFINRAEIALDLVFNNLADRDEVWKFLHQHLVRRWHGKKQKIKVIRSENPSVAEKDYTRYDAGREAPNGLVFYTQRHSRITGELNCLHIEWRLNNCRATRRAGIETGLDLIEFDHRQFWKERLLLFVADKERLGRLINNHLKGRKSRISTTEQKGKHYRINIDQRTGDIHIRSHDTIQELIDELGPTFRINRALVPISNETLLPP
jgi:hypothetical protein